MANYQNGKIYKIEDVGGNLCYIGSTTKKLLSNRMATHRGDYKKWLAGGNKITVMDIFETYGIENCRIILIELYPCNSKDELHKQEAHYIKMIDCVNKYIPGRTQAEYYQDHKEQYKEKSKQHREQNKDEIKANHDIVVNCICGRTHQKGGIYRHRKTMFHKTFMENQI